jgi:hypothetical protein
MGFAFFSDQLLRTSYKLRADIFYWSMKFSRNDVLNMLLFRCFLISLQWLSLPAQDTDVAGGRYAQNFGFDNEAHIIRQARDIVAETGHSLCQLVSSRIQSLRLGSHVADLCYWSPSPKILDVAEQRPFPLQPSI